MSIYPFQPGSNPQWERTVCILSFRAAIAWQSSPEERYRLKAAGAWSEALRRGLVDC